MSKMLFDLDSNVGKAMNGSLETILYILER